MVNTTIWPLLFQNPIISMNTKESSSMEASPINPSLFSFSSAVSLGNEMFSLYPPKEHGHMVCSPSHIINPFEYSLFSETSDLDTLSKQSLRIHLIYCKSYSCPSFEKPSQQHIRTRLLGSQILSYDKCSILINSPLSGLILLPFLGQYLGQYPSPHAPPIPMGTYLARSWNYLPEYVFPPNMNIPGRIRLC